MIVWVVLCIPNKFHHLPTNLKPAQKLSQPSKSPVAADGSSLCGRWTHTSRGQAWGESDTACSNPFILTRSWIRNYQTKVFSSSSSQNSQSIVYTFSPFELGACTVQRWGRGTARGVQGCENNPTWRIQWKVNIWQVFQRIEYKYFIPFKKYFPKCKVKIFPTFQNICQRHCSGRVWEKCCIQKGNPARCI